MAGLASTPLGSSKNWDEWDTIYMEHVSVPGLWPISPNLGQSVIATQAASNIARLVQWVSVGRTLIIAISAQQPILAGSVGSFALLPKAISVVPSAGSKMRVTAPEQAKSVLAELAKALVRYEAVFDAPGIPLLATNVTHSSKPPHVAMAFQCGKGFVIVLPSPLTSVEAAVIRIAARISPLLQTNSALPEWAEQFWIGPEQGERRAIADHRAKVEELTKSIARAESRVAEWSWLKVLFTAKDDALLDAVVRALVELGFTAAKAPGVRTDILALDRQTLIPTEVKGFDSRGATATDLGQIRRWELDVNNTLKADADSIAEDAHLRLVDQTMRLIAISDQNRAALQVKPVLVINSFRTLPLDQRTGETFAHDLSEEFRRAGVCAMTGLQIACLVVEAWQFPERKSDIRSRILATSGTFQDGDWRTFIEVQNPK